MWEYCEVKLVKGTLGGVFVKYFLANNAPIQLAKDPNFTFAKNESGLERAIAQLGLFNWELVSKPSSEAYIFKRKTSNQISIQILKGFVQVEL